MRRMAIAATSSSSASSCRESRAPGASLGEAWDFGRVVSSTRAEFASWIDGYLRKRCPELEEPLLRAIDAFDAIVGGSPITKDALTPLLAAAKSPRVPLYESATTLLATLADRDDFVREAVAEMAADSRAHVRFNAILCIAQNEYPSEFGIRLVGARLCDGSARVREKAADWALRCRMVELLPALKLALRSETSERARECIAYAVQQLQGPSFR